MYVSYNWLKEYINIDIAPEELASIFNLYGLSVEEILEIKQNFSNVYIVKILEIKKHPNADNLTVCKVTDNNEIFNIVCGAKNIKVGDIVPLAKDGAILPGNIKIKKIKIRGVDSCGMLCSSKELGLSDDHEGILILNSEEYKIGEPFTTITPDVVFNLEITPNRPDLLCITGIARFLSTILNKKLKYPSFKITRTYVNNKLDINDKLFVEIKNSINCQRYTTRIINGIKVKESPNWLKARLQSCNIRPINNIVDITNYVMLELNQPLHAFDYNKIKSGIIVRNAYDNEKILTLDGKIYELEKDDLIIADKDRPIAIAGIIGGEEFSISNKTDTVILESAYFNPKSIRKTSRRLNLSTESSYRFERGIDIENTHNALNRATEMILNIAGGKTSKNYIDIYIKKFTKKEIILHYEKINKLLGLNLIESKINSIIKRLNFKMKKNKTDSIKIQIPSYRVDINQEVDLIEDIAQIYGYNNIPNTMPISVTTMGTKSKIQLFIEILNKQLISYGFTEVINYSFLNNKLLIQLSEKDFIQENPVLLKNPFNEDEKQLKTTLVPDLLKNLILNYNKENENIHLFEIGKIYLRINNEYIEKYNLCLLTSGNIILQDYNHKGFKTDFYYLKSVITNIIINNTNINKIIFAKSYQNSSFYEYYSNILIDDNIIGKIGKVKEEILYNNKINEPVFISEISLDLLLNYLPKELKYKKLSQHPVIKRDLSIIIPDKTDENIIEEIIYKSSENYIKNLLLYDLYKGEQIPMGYKSLTYSLTFQSDNKTLTDNEINTIMNNIINNLKSEVKAELRK